MEEGGREDIRSFFRSLSPRRDLRVCRPRKAYDSPYAFTHTLQFALYLIGTIGHWVGEPASVFLSFASALQHG